MQADESPTFQQQALQIDEVNADFDPTVPPKNGAEFLMHMLYERKHCPAVVVKRPAKFLQEEQVDTPQSINKTKLDNTQSGLLPTKEWKNAQSSDFNDTRNNIAQMRQQLANCKYDQGLEPPLTTDSSDWLSFCKENQPLLRTILRLNQRTLENLLDMLCEWLSGNQQVPDEQPTTTTAVSESSSSSTAAVASEDAGAASNILDLANSEQWLGAWLYATLVCLHLPLEPDVHSTLRDIARACVQMRSSLLPQEVEKAVPYNLFIHLISSVFDQFDFAECV